MTDQTIAETIRPALREWAAWKAGVAERTETANRIEAVAESGLLAPRLRSALDLAYRDPRRTKTKYRGRSPTEYHLIKVAAEEQVAHLMGVLASNPD